MISASGSAECMDKTPDANADQDLSGLSRKLNGKTGHRFRGYHETFTIIGWFIDAQWL